MKKWLIAFVLLMVSVLMFNASALAETETIDGVDTLGELKSAMKKCATTDKDLIINLTGSIDINNDWEKIVYTVDHNITINGNGHTLTHLNKPFVAQTGSGYTLTINDLIISDSTITADPADGGNWMGVGAFVGYAGTSRGIVLNNCHLTDSTVDGTGSSATGPWAGGLIGYAAGYSNQTNGPVFETVELTNCSVKNSTITANGSAGAFMGHAMGDKWTKVMITNAVATNNIITCTESGKTNKAGDLIGTSGDGGAEVAGKAGGLFISGMTVHDNDVTSGGTKVDRAIGRYGSSGSQVTLSGPCVYDGQEPQDWELGGNGSIFAQEAVFSKPTTGAAAVHSVSAPKTGDNTPVALLLSLFMMSAAILLLNKKRFA